MSMMKEMRKYRNAAYPKYKAVLTKVLVHSRSVPWAVLLLVNVCDEEIRMGPVKVDY